MCILKKWFARLSMDNKINIVGHILTVISLSLVLATLYEMKVQRNNTYMPQIVAACNNVVEMQWNRKQDIMYLNNSEKASISYNQVYLDVYNIGVGVAKNLKFEWDINNIDNLAKYINDNSNNFQINSTNGIYTIKTDGILSGGMEFERVNNLNFLAPSNDESYKIVFPHLYLQCYKIMLIDQLREYPLIKLKISYEDIQGKSYEQILNIRVSPDFLYSLNGNEDMNYTGNAKLKLNIY
jgi:hypothetical protein